MLNWPPKKISKLTFRALALCHSDWRRANPPSHGGLIYVINSVDNTRTLRRLSPRWNVTYAGNPQRKTVVRIGKSGLSSFSRPLRSVFVKP